MQIFFYNSNFENGVIESQCNTMPKIGQKIRVWGPQIYKVTKIEENRITLEEVKKNA